MSGRSYQFGPFHLDASGRVLFRGHREIPLPPKAADTLLRLVQSAGRVLTKEDLLKQIWRGAFVEEGSLLAFSVSCADWTCLPDPWN
jgi:DNA-binding winged helix-turn-helix (wHTH) protein